MTEDLDSHQLGRIQRLPASDAIGPEDQAFTPWLAEHISLLGDALGLPMSLGDGDEPLHELIAEHTEVAVGSYRLDVRAFTADGRIVAIENQYGTSDHSHLGQVITYASGVGADVVIWIAENFSDPHLEAVRWLNQRTDERCGVFAVRIEFLRIADSPPAPRFEVVARPSEFVREQRRAQVATAHWGLDEFLDAVQEPDERAFLEDILERTQSTTSDGLWLGRKPSGSLVIYPHGVREGPVGFWINTTGRVMATGQWTMWDSIKHSPLFGPLAAYLGQSQDGPARGVPIRDLDVDGLWSRCEEFATARLAEESG